MKSVMAGAYPWPSTPIQWVEENSISTLRLKSSSSSNYRGLPNIPMSTLTLVKVSVPGCDPEQCACPGCPTSVPWRPDTWCAAAREGERSEAEIRLGEREVGPGVCHSHEEKADAKTTEIFISMYYPFKWTSARQPLGSSIDGLDAREVDCIN